MEEISIELHPDQSNSSALKQLATVIELRCVECGSLYPGISDQPRYRCDCGSVLDVDTKIQYPLNQGSALQEGFETHTTSGSGIKDVAGTQWRQLFEERAAQSMCMASQIQRKVIQR